MGYLTAELLASAEHRRIAWVLGRHVRGKGHAHRLCTECGNPYPCQTRLGLTGRLDGDIAAEAAR